MTTEQIVIAVLGVITSGSLAALLRVWLTHKRGTKQDAGEMTLEVLKFTNARVEALEGQLEAVRSEGSRQLEMVRKEAAIDQEKGRAREGYLRHRLGNALQCLDSTLLIFAVAPEKAPQLIEGIKDMRAKQEASEAAERAALAAIGIIVDDPEVHREAA